MVVRDEPMIAKIRRRTLRLARYSNKRGRGGKAFTRPLDRRSFPRLNGVRSLAASGCPICLWSSRV